MNKIEILGTKPSVSIHEVIVNIQPAEYDIRSKTLLQDFNEKMNLPLTTIIGSSWNIEFICCCCGKKIVLNFPFFDTQYLHYASYDEYNSKQLLDIVASAFYGLKLVKKSMNQNG